MRIPRAFALSFFAIVLHVQVMCCSCTGPDKFVNSIGQHMMEVEVIDVQALDTSKYAYTITRLKVLRLLKGDYGLDTLYLLNDKGFECFHSLPHKEPCRRYIVTGDLLNEWNSFQYGAASEFTGKMLVLDLCLENYLIVEGEKVIGNITRNRVNGSKLKRKLFRVFMSKNAYGNWSARRRKSPKRERLMQKMAISKLERKLKRRELI